VHLQKITPAYCHDDGGSKHFYDVSNFYQTAVRNNSEDSHIPVSVLFEF
jgi:hypothetical protein